MTAASVLAMAAFLTICVPQRAWSEPDDGVTVTLILRRSDQAAFNRYLREAYDSSSPGFHRWLGPAAQAERFGPSADVYERAVEYLRRHGLSITERSLSRLTVTATGQASAVERAFAVRLREHEAGGRRLRTSDRDPTLPADIGEHVDAVVGLSNAAEPRAEPRALLKYDVDQGKKCLTDLEARAAANDPLYSIAHADYVYLSREERHARLKKECADAYDKAKKAYGGWCAAFPFGFLCDLIGREAGLTAHGSMLGIPSSVTGAGQKVGIVAFDSFLKSDVADLLALTGKPPELLERVSEVEIHGGAPRGISEAEVLLDVATVLFTAPGAEVVVYSAPFAGGGTSFQTVFQRMIDDGVTVITNSFAYCENQTTSADVESIDSILQAAAAAGISVFNASGDRGSTCLNGSANTAHVPASSPSATAVGGTSVQYGPGFRHAHESWWNGASGQGGFGTSAFFTRPAYQDGFTGSAMRSLPDVTASADPETGVVLCQASAGGCPTGLRYGGTSYAAPLWAGFAALLNDARGENLGFLNPQLYALTDAAAFHSAAELGSDFAHVGLGSPRLSALNLALQNRAAAAVSAQQSQISTTVSRVFADGESPGTVVVQLRDATGAAVAGKTVALAAQPDTTVLITPSTQQAGPDGIAIFTATNATIEEVTFTATDTTDAIQLDGAALISFVSPPAASGAIDVSPSTVLADGTDFATITVTLVDRDGNGASGKEVSLSQGGGHSVVAGPTPALTDDEGHTSFDVRNTTAETVTYTVFDLTDGDIAIPDSVDVTFTGGTSTCNKEVTQAEPGFTVTPFATGFPVGNTFAGDRCIGSSGMAFEADGSMLVISEADGHLHRVPPGGGAVNDATRVTTTPYPPCPTGLAWSKDGEHLYLAVQRCSDVAGEVLEISPTTGDVVRTVAQVACATTLATDPISGDLFVTQPCGFNASALVRIHEPQSATPTTSVYAASPKPDGLAFAPDGTLYVTSAAAQKVVRITGTNAPTPGQVSDVTGLPSDVADEDLTGIALGFGFDHEVALLLLADAKGFFWQVDLRFDPPIVTVVADEGSFAYFLAVDAAGCAYGAETDHVIKIIPGIDTCPFVPSGAHPQLGLTRGNNGANPARDEQIGFIAKVSGVDEVENVEIVFTVNGANPRTRQMRPVDTGTAALEYRGVFLGTDTATASAVVNGKTLTSTSVSVTWAEGRHTSRVSVEGGAGSGLRNQLATVAATLVDASVTPAAPLAGQPLRFVFAPGTAQGVLCEAATDDAGRAECAFTLDVDPGLYALGVFFDGAAGDHAVAEDLVPFSIVDPGSFPPSTSTTLPASGTCADFNADTLITASDALGVLRTAVGIDACALCVCDVNGSATVTASDALAVLQDAVGQSVTLSCPACAG